MSNSINTSSFPSTCHLGPAIIKFSRGRNASHGGVAANVAAQNLPHQLLIAHVSLDRPNPLLLSESPLSMSTQSVSRDRWSTRFGHARVQIAVFKNLRFIHALHFQLSCSLDHLRVERQSCGPVSELLSTACGVKERQQLRLLQSVQLPVLRLSAVDLVPSVLAPRRIPRLAFSVAMRAVSPPPIVMDTIRMPLLCRSTTDIDRIGPCTFPATSTEVIPN